MATQNPIEYEGTFPLPEAQLDRFIMKLSVGYPTVEEEQEILSRRRGRKQDEIELEKVTDVDQVLALRQATENVFVHIDLERYIVELVGQTRKDGRVNVGASPRGSLALLKLAMASAAMDGRDFVLPDDIKSFVYHALIHRIILVPDLWMNEGASRDVVESVLAAVPVPVIS
jgi:MoxR-like ATPase